MSPCVKLQLDDHPDGVTLARSQALRPTLDSSPERGREVERPSDGVDVYVRGTQCWLRVRASRVKSPLGARLASCRSLGLGLRASAWSPDPVAVSPFLVSWPFMPVPEGIKHRVLEPGEGADSSSPRRLGEEAAELVRTKSPFKSPLQGGPGRSQATCLSMKSLFSRGWRLAAYG